VDLSASEFPAPDSEAGRALREGFAAFFDVVEFEDLRSAIRQGKVDVIVSRDREALEVAVEEDVTYFSTHASAKAVLEGLRHHDDPIDVQATSDRPKRATKWGGD
jgi:carbamoyl-phosphate synthase large subunit